MDLNIVSQAITNARAKVGFRFDLYGQIHRPTNTKTSTGGTSVVWTPVTGTIPVGIATAGGGEGQYQQAMVSRIGQRAAFELVLPFGTAIQEADRLYVAYPDARTFEIIGLANDAVTFQLVVKAIGIELT